MRKPRFNTQWYRHIRDEGEREKFEATVRASRTALDRLADIIRERVDSLNDQEASLTDFEDAAWSHKQAHRNGQRAMAKAILDLLSLTKE